MSFKTDIMKPIPIRSKFLHILLGIFVFVLLAYIPYSQTNFLEGPVFDNNPEEILGLLSKAFSEQDMAQIDQISSDQFCGSDGYSLLSSYINSCYINLSYRTELIEKEFLIKGRAERLVVLFERDQNDKTWAVADAYFREKNGNKKKIENASFSPLSYAEYFNSMLLAIERKDLKYFGLAPRGKLNLEELESLELSLSKNTVITYKNVIIHDETKPLEFTYISLRDYSCEENDARCGWLIEKAGSMKEFYKDDLFIQYLINESNHPPLETSNEINRSFDISSFQDERIFEAQKANLNSLIFKKDFDSSTIYKKYIVKPGDNLSSISSMHGVDLQYLRTLNNLKGDYIYINQLLVLPRNND